MLRKYSQKCQLSSIQVEEKGRGKFPAFIFTGKEARPNGPA
jgi:hypothetical protein